MATASMWDVSACGYSHPMATGIMWDVSACGHPFPMAWQQEVCGMCQRTPVSHGNMKYVGCVSVWTPFPMATGSMWDVSAYAHPFPMATGSVWDVSACRHPYPMARGNSRMCQRVDTRFHGNRE